MSQQIERRAKELPISSIYGAASVQSDTHSFIVLFVEIARASNATRHRREGDAANAPCGACQKDVQQTTRRRVDAKEFPVDAVFVRVKYDIIIHSYRIVFVQSFT